MKLTSEAIDLIKTFEGCRYQAYRDAVGVWTIGYGHTAMAGPPVVTAAMTISQAKAEAILVSDLEHFAQGVHTLVKRQLTDSQFSALVSFAYNVGLSSLAKSSVLAAVNAGDFDVVPRRLSLWVKAGGKTLPGLIKRRAAEAALFSEQITLPGRPENPASKPAYQSKTIWAAAAALLAAIGQYATSEVVALGFVLVIAAAAAIIIYERKKKLKLEGL